MGAHQDITNIHRVYDQTYADNTARDADTTWNGASGNLGKCVLVGTDEVYMLTATTPTWTQLTVDEASETDTIYTADGTVSAARTVTLTDNLTIKSDTDGNDTVEIGDSLSDRIDTFNVWTDNTATLNSGATNDRSFLALFGTTLKGIQLQYFENETSAMGFNINVGDDQNLEVIDQVGSKGMIYAADYSSNYTDRSIPDKAYVDTGPGSIYNTSGTLSGNRTVTGNSGNSLTFNHYNGTSSTYTLRTALLMEDTDLTISAHLGDGFGSDLAVDSISMLNNGMEINTAIGDADVYQRGNDWTFYEGSSSSSDATLTVHGDGNHSVFDPFMTLHEGFATGNGTNSQALICNFGKAAKVQWNDGTRSVDVFHIHGIVNGAETFTHMETSFQSTRHDYVDIDRWDWYFDTSGTTNQINIYNDDSGTTNIFRLDDGGNLSLDGNLRVGGIGTGNQLIDVIGPTNANAEIHIESGDSAAYSSILNLESENAWEFQSYHFVSATSNLGQLEVRNDTTGQLYLSFRDADTDMLATVPIEYDGAYLVPQFASQVLGASTNVTVTTTEQTITLDTSQIDGSASEYTINLANNRIDFGGADGTKVFEVTMDANFLLTSQGTTGSTRSFGRIKARLDAVDVAYSEMWCYIREWQGATNGDPSTGRSNTFLIQPALDDQLDFRVWGTTDTGTITDFELNDFRVVIKRVA